MALWDFQCEMFTEKRQPHRRSPIDEHILSLDLTCLRSVDGASASSCRLFLRCLTWKSEHFYRKKRRRFIWLRRSDVPAFSGFDAVEESIEQCCTCIVSMWERERERRSVYFSLCVSVSVFFLTAWVSQFEMQHLQMCLVNCSPKLLSHSEGTTETKQLKSLSAWGAKTWCAWVCLPALKVCMFCFLLFFKLQSFTWTAKRQLRANHNITSSVIFMSV